MAGRLIIIEPAMVDERGHHAFAAGRFASLIGAERTIIAAGLGWRGPRALGGGHVLPMFRHSRKNLGRIRRYGESLSAALEKANFAVDLFRRLRNQRAAPSPVSRAIA